MLDKVLCQSRTQTKPPGYHRLLFDYCSQRRLIELLVLLMLLLPLSHWYAVGANGQMMLMTIDPRHLLRHAVTLVLAYARLKKSTFFSETHKSKNANWLGLLPYSYTKRLAK